LGEEPPVVFQSRVVYLGFFTKASVKSQDGVNRF
jgi:hypothetical protein